MRILCYFILDCSSCWTNGRVVGDLWSLAANVTIAMISLRWPVEHVGGHCCGYISGTMMTSSNGNIYCVTGPLWGESIGGRWIPLKKASDAEFWCFLWSAPEKNGWANTRDAGDFGRHRAHYDVAIMWRNRDTRWSRAYNNHCIGVIEYTGMVDYLLDRRIIHKKLLATHDNCTHLLHGIASSFGFHMTVLRGFMMTSSNGNIFRVTGPLCGEFTGPGEFPTQRPVTRSFDVFFDLRLNKRLN